MMATRDCCDVFHNPLLPEPEYPGFRCTHVGYPAHARFAAIRKRSASSYRRWAWLK